MESIKCLIIGSGPAGFTAAIYASRANLSPVLYEGPQSGGQLITTTVVENFPGYPEGVSGYDMMEDMRAQATRFGADIRNGIITSVDFSSAPYTVTIDGSVQIQAETIIISTGATAKYLGLPDETKYAGRGVSACATCDGFFFRKKVVAVVGGGDTACEEAAYLSTLARKVYLIVRKNYLRASDIMQKRVLDNPNIEVLFSHNAEGLTGENKVQGVKLVKDLGQPTEEHYEREIDGFFLATPMCSNLGLRPMKTDISKLCREHRSPMSLESLLQAMWLTQPIVRLSALQLQDARRLSKQNVILTNRNPH